MFGGAAVSGPVVAVEGGLLLLDRGLVSVVAVEEGLEFPAVELGLLLLDRGLVSVVAVEEGLLLEALVCIFSISNASLRVAILLKGVLVRLLECDEIFVLWYRLSSSASMGSLPNFC